jgi:hypothetical protein
LHEIRNVTPDRLHRRLAHRGTGERGGQGVREIVAGWRRPFYAEADIPIVNPPVVDEGLHAIEHGSFGCDNNVGSLDELVSWIA